VSICEHRSVPGCVRHSVDGLPGRQGHLRASWEIRVRHRWSSWRRRRRWRRAVLVSVRWPRGRQAATPAPPGLKGPPPHFTRPPPSPPYPPLDCRVPHFRPTGEGEESQRRRRPPWPPAQGSRRQCRGAEGAPATHGFGAARSAPRQRRRQGQRRHQAAEGCAAQEFRDRARGQGGREGWRPLETVGRPGDAA